MNRKTFAVLLLLLSVATAYGIQAQTEWVRFTSPKGLFSVLLPHEAKLEAQPDSTPEAIAHQRFNDFENGYGFVMESFENAPASDPEKYLEGTRDGIVNVTKGTLISETKLSLDGHPGREVAMSFKNENGVVIFSRTRIYLVGTNLFSLSYVWRNDLDAEAASKMGEKYFSSLKIKPVE